MRIIVAVVVYDRLNNIAEWIRSWKLCDKRGAELFIIHNYKSDPDIQTCRAMCESAGVTYIRRKNVGMDIGAFQDVCRGRLEGFPNQWDYLFWCTDDVIPMSKTFIAQFLEVSKRSKVGISCLEISREVKTHVRTAGFMIDQGTASKVTFPADTVITKLQCYEFEHRSKKALYEQVHNMGKLVTQVHPDFKKGPLWDTHVRGHLKRWNEHYNEFPK